MKWKIYYSDKSTIDDTQKDPFDLDGDKERARVQVIIQPTGDPRAPWVTSSGDDYYVWDDLGDGYRWVGMDYTGFMLYMLKKGKKCVLFGEIVSNKRFEEIFADATKECGKKNTFSPKERKP